ncbi:MAG: hypothetical protein FXV80_04810 [Candidatus Thioglobus sp.]|nr:MAG: hypothetical protein FXV80_04810 [Candidatus Thioglobus sp.]
MTSKQKFIKQIGADLKKPIVFVYLLGLLAFIRGFYLDPYLASVALLAMAFFIYRVFRLFSATDYANKHIKNEHIKKLTTSVFFLPLSLLVFPFTYKRSKKILEENHQIKKDAEHLAIANILYSPIIFVLLLPLFLLVSWFLKTLDLKKAIIHTEAYRIIH